jgi:hypothetical protein
MDGLRQLRQANALAEFRHKMAGRAAEAAAALAVAAETNGN